MEINKKTYKRDTLIVSANNEGEVQYFLVNGMKPQSKLLLTTEILTGERFILVPENYRPFWVQIGDYLRVGNGRYRVKSFVRRNMETGHKVVAYVEQIEPNKTVEGNFEKYIPLSILKKEDFVLVDKDGIEL